MMWDYSGKVKEHFRNPRNVGVIEEADGIGEVGSLACGDMLKLTFSLDKDGRIAEAKFQTFGCASAIASSSALTEIIKGMTLEQAEKVSNRDIAAHLDGLPEQKMHCSVMGREALQAAIKNCRTGKRVSRELKERVVCTCFGVTEPEIEQVVRENNLSTVEDVTNYCKAGGGCGTCRGDIAEIISRIRGEPVEAIETKKTSRKMTNIQKIKLIEETIEREIRPALQQDGGDIELIDLEGNRVLVSFRGACAKCRVAEFTVKTVVQPKLREFVCDDLCVEEVEQ